MVVINALRTLQRRKFRQNKSGQTRNRGFVKDDWTERIQQWLLERKDRQAEILKTPFEDWTEKQWISAMKVIWSGTTATNRPKKKRSSSQSDPSGSENEPKRSKTSGEPNLTAQLIDELKEQNRLLRESLEEARKPKEIPTPPIVIQEPELPAVEIPQQVSDEEIEPEVPKAKPKGRTIGGVLDRLGKTTVVHKLGSKR